MRKVFLSLLVLSGCGLDVAARPVEIKGLWEKKHHEKPHSIQMLWKRPGTQTEHTIKNLWERTPAQHDTVTRIHVSQHSLHQASTQQQQMNQQLARIARAIKQAELENIAISKVLDRLEKEQKQSEAQYQTARRRIDSFGGEIRKLDTTIKSHHERFIHLLADEFAFITAMRAINHPTPGSVVQQEAYEVYKQKNNHILANLKARIDGSKHARAQMVARRDAIRKSIRSIQAKRELYQKKKAEKEALLASLAAKEKEYRRQLKNLMLRQKLLRQTLAKLSILRKEEIARARQEEAARRAELKRKTEQLKRLREKQAARIKAAKAEGRKVTYTTPQIPTPPAAAGRVKQYGSSYQINSIQAYRGPRTISPLPHAEVVKKFGTYIDPIYKIKIFNDNVVLRARKNDAKVRNVLNGKVVYIGENSMLGKVVIVEHGNRLHTIYAALDRISPLLHRGSRVRKGTIIGRIKRTLIFQATQNSKYINPLRLIRL